MTKRSVCMMVLNGVVSDPRVTKEAETLSKHYQVTVVGYGKKDEQATASNRSYRIILAPERTSRTSQNRLLNAYLKSIHKLKGMWGIYQAAKAQRADIYHAHDFEMLPLAVRLGKRNKSLRVYDSHELWIEQKAGTPRLVKRILRFIEGRLIRKCDSVITVNESIAIELRQRYRLPALPTILHNYTPLDREGLQIKQMNDERKQVVVLYHGGYIKDRGLNELIQAAHYLPDHVSVHFRGMGPIENELRNEAGNLIETGKIVFHPPVAMVDLVKSAGSADIGFIPYQPTCLNNYYSLPNKLSEYAMAGLAICASNLPEIKKLNEQVGFGNLFDPYSPKSMAEAIMATCADPQTLMLYRKHSIQWAATTGNWESESIKLTTEYSRLFGVGS